MLGIIVNAEAAGQYAIIEEEGVILIGENRRRFERIPHMRPGRIGDVKRPLDETVMDGEGVGIDPIHFHARARKRIPR